MTYRLLRGALMLAPMWLWGGALCCVAVATDGAAQDIAAVCGAALVLCAVCAIPIVGFAQRVD